jgi:hypothetical protein
MKMSKLFDHLQATDTGNRKHIQKPLKMVTGTVNVHEMYIQEDVAKVYRVEARLGAQVVVTPELLQLADSNKYIKDKVYRPLAEEVFGEFRQPLIDADFAIFQGDYELASKLIREVLDTMFKV